VSSRVHVTATKAPDGGPPPPVTERLTAAPVTSDSATLGSGSGDAGLSAEPGSMCEGTVTGRRQLLDASGGPLVSGSPSHSQTTSAASEAGNSGTTAVGTQADAAANGVQGGGFPPPVTVRSATSPVTLNSAAKASRPFDMRTLKIPKLTKQSASVTTAAPGVQLLDVSIVIADVAVAGKVTADAEDASARAAHARIAAHTLLGNNTSTRPQGGGSPSTGAVAACNRRRRDGSGWQTADKSGTAHACHLQAGVLVAPPKRPRRAKVRRRVLDPPRVSEASERACLEALQDDAVGSRRAHSGAAEGCCPPLA
jgi:hypothetical protein